MEEQIQKIKDSKRTARRKQQKSLGTSALAYIVELVTNSDDSYKRLETIGKLPIDSVKPIYISITHDKESNIISVVDNAEGMDKETINRIFVDYGGDNAKGESTGSRGIFGQGATDVMVNSSMDKKKAMLESIKDEEFSKFYFRWDEDSSDKLLINKTPSFNVNQFQNLRKTYSIPGNGTRMTFGVPSGIKFNEDTIIDELEQSYSLRYILSSSNREVIFIGSNHEKHKLSSLKYCMREENILSSKKFSFSYEGIDLKCELTFYRNENKSKELVGQHDILVTDSRQVVFADTMFGFNKMPKTKDLSGILKIDGLYALCKKHLNQEKPDEIINDDRTGFNEKHDFYKFFTKKYIDNLISSCIAEHCDTDNEIEISQNKKFKKALTAINKWFTEEFKRKIPGSGALGNVAPIDGLDFGKSKITITNGVCYDLKLLINSNLITTNDDIFVEITGNWDNNISVTPDVITYKESEVNGDLVIKNISILAQKITSPTLYVTITVSSKIYSKSIAVQVIDKEIIYPEGGFQFERDKATFSPIGIHKSNVWFDTNFFKIGTMIKIKSDKLEISNNQIVLSSSNLVSENIGMIQIESTGGNIGDKCKITATIENKIEITQDILIDKFSDKISGTNGMITNIKIWTDDGVPFQTVFQEKTGTVYINSKNLINISMMGDLSLIDAQNPQFSSKQYSYLSVLLANQSAVNDVKELERMNQISINESSRMDDYLQNIEIKKAEIYNRIRKAMDE